MIFAGALRGIEGRVVEVTADVAMKALPSFTIKGLSDAAQRESRVRVQGSLAAARVDVARRVDVTCNAGGFAIDGTALDLGIALAVAGGSISDVGAVGELSLSGDVRPVRGVLPIVDALKSRVRLVFVARESAQEAALVDGVRVVAVRTLSEALAYVRGETELPPSEPVTAPSTQTPFLDMRDVRGQRAARRALEIAAAGSHNILFVGGPGAGKTMLARRLAGLLPPMTDEEALEVTRVHSVAGLNIGGGLARQRPFRAPHHSTTPPGLVGGGAALPRPGEVSLAHNGVLFLDELPEFARATLEVLSTPLETHEVVLARASGSLRFPSRTLVVGSMSPCPCGRFGSSRCSCDTTSRARYAARAPEQLLRRFDLRVFVETINVADIDGAPAGEDTALMRARVVSARTRMTSEVKMPWEAQCARPLASAADSASAYERAVRVATTIAALAGDDFVQQQHVVEAMRLTRDLAAVIGGAGQDR